MPETKYTVNRVDPIGLKSISNSDSQIVESFSINSTFTYRENLAELHIYSLDGELLDSIVNFQNIKFLQGSLSDDSNKASSFTLDPIEDAKNNGYTYGGIVNVYNFLNDLYSNYSNSTQFYVKEISPDRKELRLLSTDISNEEIVTKTEEIKNNLKKNSYYNNFKLNFFNNNLFIGVNIKTQKFKDYESVVVKLYEPLPDEFGLKDKLSIQSTIVDSVAYQVDSETVGDEIVVPYLKGPNFGSEFVDEQTNIPTSFLNYNELFSFPTQNSYRELNSLFKEKSVNISIDYSDYSDFTNFSSVNERLRNFKYKLDLINSYQSSLDSIENSTSSSIGISGSRDYYQGLITSILDNFDHYDRHLYYESGSTSWPKQVTVPNTKPYTNATGSATGSWYTDQLLSSSNFDDTNTSLLLNTVPTYLREDPQNAPYATFIHMIGQHFDNLWVYTKAVTDKYNSDNRLNNGISKDLVEDALRNFGVKLYTSNKSTEDLFKTFTGELYSTGSEQITSFTSASNNATSEENYRKELYKRLYHNLPLLLKSKGTERGVRALLNSFGIPTLYSSGSHTGLKVKSVGGSNTTENVNIGPLLITTSSVGKVRLDDTGSITTGNTLSQYTSILKRDQKYSNDSHAVEIGYSQTDVINEAILNTLSSSSYNIDEFIGDPNLAGSSSYADLISSSNSVLENILTGSNDQQDFTRILKFYDNVVFKTVKDFTPARSNLSTGIIVKPHILERNKAKQVTGEFSFNEYSGSVASGSRTGSSGDTFGGRDQYSTAYSESIITPDGLATYTYHNQEEPKYDGEFSGSFVVASTSELNDENTYKYDTFGNASFKYTFTSAGCNFILSASTGPSVDPSPTPSPSVSTDCSFTVTGSLTHIDPSPSVTPTVTPTVTPSPTVSTDCSFTISGSLTHVDPSPSVTPSVTPSTTPSTTPSVSSSPPASSPAASTPASSPAASPPASSPAVDPSPSASPPNSSPAVAASPSVTPSPSPVIYNEIWLGAPENGGSGSAQEGCAQITQHRAYVTSSITGVSSITTSDTIFTDSALTMPYSGALTWYGAADIQGQVSGSVSILINSAFHGTGSNIDTILTCPYVPPSSTPSATPTVFSNLLIRECNDFNTTRLVRVSGSYIAGSEGLGIRVSGSCTWGEMTDNVCWEIASHSQASYDCTVDVIEMKSECGGLTGCVDPSPSVTPSVTPTVTPSPTTNYNYYTLTACPSAGGAYSDVRIPAGAGLSVGVNDVVLMPDGCYTIDDAEPIGISTNDYLAVYTDCIECEVSPSPSASPDTLAPSKTPTATPTPSVTPTTSPPNSSPVPASSPAASPPNSSPVPASSPAASPPNSSPVPASSPAASPPNSSPAPDPSPSVTPSTSPPASSPAASPPASSPAVSPSVTPSVTPSESPTACIALDVHKGTNTTDGCCNNFGIQYFNANSLASATRHYTGLGCTSLSSGTRYFSDDGSTYYEFFNGVKVGSGSCPACP